MNKQVNISGSINPNFVYVVSHIQTTLISLAGLVGTVFLAMNHLVADGEIVTLLVAFAGLHALKIGGGSTSTTTTTTAPVVVPEAVSEQTTTNVVGLNP